ncbi:MAG: hypothetical protein QM759_12770 [Terricaulis sp.]
MNSKSEIAAKLVVEAAVGAIAGTVRGQLGIAPVVLSERQCAELGLPPGSNTMFYPVDDSGVFFDVDDARMTIWYSGPDAQRGLNAVETALKRAYPQAKQAKDEPDTREPSLRVRSYDVRFNNGRLATIDIGYPPTGGRVDKFVAQVVGMERKKTQ